jgi:hypothetical protein
MPPLYDGYLHTNIEYMLSNKIFYVRVILSIAILISSHRQDISLI